MRAISVSDCLSSMGAVPGFLEGGGTCGALIAAQDWAATTLGPLAAWPQSLRTILSVILRSPTPMGILWGEEGLLLHNDGYLSFTGGRHPSTLGRPIHEIWPERRAFHENILQVVLSGGTLSYKDVEIEVGGRGSPDPAFFNLDYSPILGDHGRPAGVLAVVAETTTNVLAVRALCAAETRAREGAERVQLALDAGAVLGTWNWDVAADRFTADERFARSFGLDPGACEQGLPSEAMIGAVHSDDLPGMREAVAAVLRDGGAYCHQCRVRVADGRTCWIEVIGRVDLGPGGTPLRFTGVFLDIDRRRAAEAERDRTERLLRAFVDAVPGLVYAKDREGRILLANRGFAEDVRRPSEECLGRTELDLLSNPDEVRVITATDRRIMDSGLGEQIEERVSRPDGTPAVWFSTKAPLRDASGAVVGLVGSSLDITERKAAEIALAESEARFRNMADHAPVMMWVTDPAGACVYFNRLWYDFTGQTVDQALGTGWLEVSHPDDRAEAEHVFMDANLKRVPFRIEYRIRRSDGAWRWAMDAAAPRWGPSGEFLGFIGSVIDITERKEAEQELERARLRAEYAARHDSLTGLNNRSWFRRRLERQLEQHDGSDLTALLFLDMDQFKSVNDSFGHPAGDELLVQVGRRLQSCLSASDVIARFGGDEFAVLRTGVTHRRHITEAAERITKRLSEPYLLDSREAVIGVSIGIAIVEAPGANADELLKRADIALYRAKADGRGVFRFFEPGMERSARETQELRTDLYEALARGEFLIHYQPVVEFETHRVTGFEALLRWRHPRRGVLGPGEFVPLAEESGVIEEIGAWVIREACARAATWPGEPLISVNLSSRQFRGGKLFAVVQDALLSSRLPAHRLQLEITESMLLQDDRLVRRSLRELRRHGVRISIDDFGTGYSSLGYLRRFSVDNIKVDRSFVRDLGDNPRTSAILRAVVHLARELDVSVTAEGVETADQVEQLRALGCRQGQGYLFSRPLPAEELDWCEPLICDWKTAAWAEGEVAQLESGASA